MLLAELICLCFLFISQCNYVNSQRRIRNGSAVPLDAAKGFVVYLTQAQPFKGYDNWICGGSIVTSNYILTSAACVMDVDYMYAIAGYNQYVTKENIDNDTCTSTSKKKVTFVCTPHAYELSYNNIDKWASLDIALVKVETPYTFGPTASAGCTWPVRAISINYETKYQAVGTDAVVYGWGHKIMWRLASNTRQTDYNTKELQYTRVLITDIKECEGKYNFTQTNTTFTVTLFATMIKKYMLCTGAAEGNIDVQGTYIRALKPEDYHRECWNDTQKTLRACPDVKKFDWIRQNEIASQQIHSSALYSLPTPQPHSQSFYHMKSAYPHSFNSPPYNLHPSISPHPFNPPPYNLHPSISPHPLNPPLYNLHPSNQNPFNPQPYNPYPSYPPKEDETFDGEIVSLDDILTNYRKQLKKQIINRSKPRYKRVKNKLRKRVLRDRHAVTQPPNPPTPDIIRADTDENKEPPSPPVPPPLPNDTSQEWTSKPGICQNDHGGPLVTWIGQTEFVIGVASMFRVSNGSHCIGPYLFTSTSCNGAFIKCVLDIDGPIKTRRGPGPCDNLPSDLKILRRKISWKSHPDGPAANELSSDVFDRPQKSIQDFHPP